MASPAREHRILWSYTATATQSAGGGGNIVLHFAPAAGTAVKVLRGSLFSAANKAAQARLLDEDQVANAIMATVTLNNTQTFFPGLGGAATGADNTIGSGADLTVPGDGSSIECRMLTAANGEAFRINLVCELIGTHVAPSVSVARSTGTVAAPTETQNEVTVVPAV